MKRLNLRAEESGKLVQELTGKIQYQKVMEKTRAVMLEEKGRLLD